MHSALERLLEELGEPLTPASRPRALEILDGLVERLTAAGHGKITAEIRPAPDFYFAEEYHQQYLHKNPNGYCGLAGTGVSCPVGLGCQTISKDA